MSNYNIDPSVLNKMHGILNCNALDLIDALQDESVHLTIADPPYGISYQSMRTDKKCRKPKIQNDETPYTEWIKPLFNKMSWGGRLICFYRWDVQDEFLYAIKEAGFSVKSQIVWDKISHGMGDLKGEFAPQHELMIYATKGRYEFEGNRPKTIYRQCRILGEQLTHPNEKPVNLIAALIRDISSKKDNILDPFGGSFSTYRASIKEGRKCLSCELGEHEFKNGSKLVNQGVNLSIF
jgi:site-specific DNA-methyltransferase (adenine-specific)